MSRAPVRVCHVSPHLPPDQAANALLPATLGGWQRDAGHDVRFVAHEPAQGGAVSGEDLAGPVRWVTRHRPRSAVARLLKVPTMRTARAVQAALDATAADADIVHLHSNGLIIEVAAGWARRHGIPTVLTLYGTEIWHYAPRQPIDPFRRAYDRAGAVTFYSRGLRDRALELGLDRPGLEVVYPAVRDVFRPLSEADRRATRASLGLSDAGMILNVKRLHRLAGQDVLLDAFAAVLASRPGTQLVICGTGPEADALAARARSLGIAPNVRFTGLLPNDDIARHAAAADVFALPSRLEALPTVAVEALAAGTPVVSADHPGGLELHGLFGDDVRVVPREAPGPLADALEEALRAPRRSSDVSRARVVELFGPAAVRAAYETIYGRVVAASGRV